MEQGLKEAILLLKKHRKKEKGKTQTSAMDQGLKESLREARALLRKHKRRKGNQEYNKTALPLRFRSKEAERWLSLKEKLKVTHSDLVNILINCYEKHEGSMQETRTTAADVNASGFSLYSIDTSATESCDSDTMDAFSMDESRIKQEPDDCDSPGRDNGRLPNEVQLKQEPQNYADYSVEPNGDYDGDETSES